MNASVQSLVANRRLARRRTMIAALIAAVSLAGCGDGDDRPATTDAAEIAEAAMPAPAPDNPQPAEPVAPPPEAPAPAPAADDVVPAPPPAEPQLPPPAAADIAPDPDRIAAIENADIGRGQSYAQRCVGCHWLHSEELPPAGPQLGPILFDVVGAPVGRQAGFGYSPALAAMRDAGTAWTELQLDAFLADPAAAAPGTTMTQGGIADADNRANVIAYLATLIPEPGEPPADPELVARIAAADPAEGEALATRCGGCHRFGTGESSLIGPNLFGVFGAPIGGEGGFAYSVAMQDLGAAGAIWTADRLDAFLESPAVTVPGTRMGFAGIADANERAAIIAYLRTLNDVIRPIDLGDEQPLLGIGVYRADLDRLTFSRTQAEFGDRYYTEGGCERCHGGALEGTAAGPDGRPAPALVGPAFQEKWFAGNLFQLYSFIYFHAGAAIVEGVTPYLTAFILQRNGFQIRGPAMPQERLELQRIGFYQ